MTLDDHLVDYDQVADNRDAERWKPLRVSCRLEQAILSDDDGTRLDGLLSIGAFRRLTDEQQNALPDIHTTPWPVDFDLPVARWAVPLEAESADQVDDRLLTQDGKVWGWCTSDQVADWVHREKESYYGKQPAGAFKRNTTKPSFNAASGRYKAIAEHFEALWPKDEMCVWYALGDPDGVARLLEHVPYIGAKHNTGHGKVRCDLDGTPRWEVEVIDEDRSIEHDGELTRAMPIGYDDRWEGRRQPVRAPNWHSSRYVLCVDPE